MADAALVEVVWLALDEAELDPDEFSASLAAEEHERASRYFFPRDRRRYVLRHGILRSLLAERLACSPREVRLRYNEFGKPSLEGSAIRFSLSHSRGMALYAFAEGIELGCDIEYRDAAMATSGIAQRFFSRAELETLGRLAGDARIEAFFNCWTRKEAFVKALGRGLSLPLDSFDVSLAPGEPASLGRGCAGWAVESLDLHADYAAAVVAQAARLSVWPRRFAPRVANLAS